MAAESNVRYIHTHSTNCKGAVICLGFELICGRLEFRGQGVRLRSGVIHVLKNNIHDIFLAASLSTVAKEISITLIAHVFLDCF